MPLSNCERQARYRARHPDRIALRAWLRRLSRLVCECPDSDIASAVRGSVDYAVRCRSEANGGRR